MSIVIKGDNETHMRCREEKVETCSSLNSICANLEDFKQNGSDRAKSELAIGINFAYDCASKQQSSACLRKIKGVLVDFQDMERNPKQARKNGK